MTAHNVYCRMSQINCIVRKNLIKWKHSNSCPIIKPHVSATQFKMGMKIFGLNMVDVGEYGSELRKPKSLRKRRFNFSGNEK